MRVLLGSRFASWVVSLDMFFSKLLCVLGKFLKFLHTLHDVLGKLFIVTMSRFDILLSESTQLVLNFCFVYRVHLTRLHQRIQWTRLYRSFYQPIQTTRP